MGWRGLRLHRGNVVHCEPWNPPDGGWDTMVPGGTVIIMEPPEDDTDE